MMTNSVTEAHPLGDEGLQQCGFQGSRCGPVMNCVGLVQSGLIVSLYFNRKGDGILNTVKSLMRFLGYGVEPHLRDRLDVVVMSFLCCSLQCVATSCDSCNANGRPVKTVQYTEEVAGTPDIQWGNISGLFEKHISVLGRSSHVAGTG
jgi:hypothetical protein